MSKTMADPRGPIRTIIAVEKLTDAALVQLSCGHVRRFNPIFHYKVGSDARCLECLKEGKS